MKQLHQLVLASILGSLLSPWGLGQNSVTMTSMMDNTLFEDALGSLSSGAGPNFYTGQNNFGQLRRGVLAFDIDGNVPAGATIDSVRLTLRMSMANSGPFDCELRVLLAGWGEGTSNSSGGQGAPATTNDATWLHTFYNTQFWTTPGGNISPVISDVVSVDGVGHYTWGSTPQMVTDVQMWLDNPTTNFGWVVIGNETVNQSAKRFDTKENSTAANRPSLTVFFTPPLSVADPDQQITGGFRLDRNFPNPFNPTTRIPYTIERGMRVVLKVYDSRGNALATLIDKTQGTGRYEVSWDASHLASGVYYYRIEADGFSSTHAMVLLK